MRVLIAFDDMIVDMKSNKKLSHCIILKRKKTRYFTCFYITILFQSTLMYNTKRNTLFYHENS